MVVGGEDETGKRSDDNVSGAWYARGAIFHGQ